MNDETKQVENLKKVIDNKIEWIKKHVEIESSYWRSSMNYSHLLRTNEYVNQFVRQIKYILLALDHLGGSWPEESIMIVNKHSKLSHAKKICGLPVYITTFDLEHGWNIVTRNADTKLDKLYWFFESRNMNGIDSNV